MTPGERQDFRTYVARTLFVQAWAEWAEQYGDHYAPGTELMAAAPETPAYVYESADNLIARLEKEIAPLDAIAERARATWTGNSPMGVFIDELAYSLTMGSLGHGVGWTDYHEPFEGCRGLRHFEFTCLDLDDENYPIPEEEPA